LYSGANQAKIIVDSSQPANSGALAPEWRGGYGALLVQTAFPRNAQYRVFGGRNPSLTAHQTEGQSNPAVTNAYHLHTHIADFWVHDYSEGYLPDHESANWPPTFPPEENFTMFMPSVSG